MNINELISNTEQYITESLSTPHFPLLTPTASSRTHAGVASREMCDADAGGDALDAEGDY